ncbi:transcriptional regulator [Methylobacterium sp. BTF04]|uniref:helix-turn-helix domain-containing protein n=1 Tax=Methylobacterium sp. BTF04 TaxID=2708300 RepID=UPI0013D5E539|nr:transcriptional regulator [Methylobacterium sp. BTF04]NEU13043.1 transcriptional regulator [Methylobacterium sp. BTF04]
MADVTDDVFGDLVAGLGQAIAHARGEADSGVIVHVPDSVDVAGIRKRTGKTQPAFAASIGVPVATLRQWEHRRRQPKGAARVLLALIERNPRLVEETLGRL